MKFNGKCKIRLLRDFPTINLRMGDSLTVYKYKYKKCMESRFSSQWMKLRQLGLPGMQN